MIKGDSVFVGSDNDVVVKGVALESAPAEPINTATVTFALYASEANALAETSPISGTSGTCDYVTDSNGEYRGVLADNQTSLLTLGVIYWLGVKIIINGATDRRAISYTARGRRNR